MDTEDLALVETFSDDNHAWLAKARLEQAGIEALISEDDLGGLMPQLQLTEGVRLFVRSANLEQAKQVLAEPVEIHDEDGDDEPEDGDTDAAGEAEE